jgi:hypothetical protein
MAARCWASTAKIGLGVAFVFHPAILTAQVTNQNLSKIETIVVIYAENRSFDHLYGFFPGANGIAQATNEQKTQLALGADTLAHGYLGKSRLHLRVRLPGSTRVAAGDALSLVVPPDGLHLFDARTGARL